jgi:Pregnancy-associated plasma protein-A
MPRRCGTMVLHEYLAETTPSYRGALERVERDVQRKIASGEAMKLLGKLLTVNVVVHVVYKRAAENISDAQVKSQIDVLNKDFRAKNADKSKVPSVWSSLIADSNIKFQLAKRDPRGRATKGITRTKTTRSAFPADNSVKTKAGGGIAPWPPNRYLNIWVCNLGDGLLGYAQFPGGPAKTDGVVILHRAFGTTGTAKAPFDKGRTATHEVGHWLDLRHIWADTLGCGGSDFVADTPNQAGPNFGSPTFPKISCLNGPHGDMFMNYMDYVDDAAMVMFTTGQGARMNACLAGTRKGVAK